ncbi:hypothetical protein ACT3CD_02180 [Geofilum sp. OHC36d9]|uniref:hypothetical protein n=1 Tax=Geofilum sp. OHC36d9 TaxID=3458413 RepID=UPI00403370A5
MLSHVTILLINYKQFTNTIAYKQLEWPVKSNFCIIHALKRVDNILKALKPACIEKGVITNQNWVCEFHTPFKNKLVTYKNFKNKSVLSVTKISYKHDIDKN